MNASEFIELYKQNHESAHDWLEKNPKSIESVVITFTLDNLMEIAWIFVKKNGTNPDSLRNYMASESDKKQMADTVKSLLSPIITLITAAPDHFITLLKTPDDLQHLYLLNALITEHLIDNAPNDIKKLFTNLEHFLALNEKIAESIIKKIPEHIAGLFENIEQFLKLPSEIQNNLTQYAPEAIAKLCKNTQHFNQLTEQSARNLCSKAPTHIASLFHTAVDFLTVHESKYYQETLQKALVEGASEILADLFYTGDLINKTIGGKCASVMTMLIKKQPSLLASRFTKSKQIIQAMNYVTFNAAKELFSHNIDVFINVCKKPDAVADFAKHGFRDFNLLVREAFTQREESLISDLVMSWTNFTSETQINCLLVFLSVFQNLTSNEITNTKFEKASEDLFNRLSQLKHSFPDVLKLSFHGQYLNNDMWSVISSIFDQSQLNTIEFVGDFQHFGKPYTTQNCYMNLNPDYTIPFINLMMQNTTLVSCNMSTYYANKPIQHLCTIIIDRNKRLKNTPAQTDRDSILARFTQKINAQVGNIKKRAEIYKSESLLELPEPKTPIYSQDLQLLFFADNLAENKSTILDDKSNDKNNASWTN